jgi:hypothetical protein
MSQAEASLHYFVDHHAQAFGSWDQIRELRQGVKVLYIKAFQDFTLDESIEIHQIAHHAGSFIYRAAYGCFKHVIVAVAMRIIAFAVGVPVLFV